MAVFIFWLIGWVILSLGFYINNVYIYKDKTITKKLHAWHALWSGIFSWFGIAFCISICIVYMVCKANDWIENKLSK